MDRMKLDLEGLRVETFETHTAHAAAPGEPAISRYYCETICRVCGSVTQVAF